MKSQIIYMLLLTALLPLFAGDWQVNDKGDNKVIFHSKSTLIDFDGTTDNIDGYIYWDGEEAFSGKNEFYFEVQLETFDTGNGKRDRDMRSDVLQTLLFPLASFSGTLTHIKKTDDRWMVTVSGEMSLHGKKKHLQMPATITIKDGIMHVSTAFSLYLHDYDIKAPQLAAFVKVADEVKLDIHFDLKEYTD